MDQEKWQEIKVRIKEQFAVESEEQGKLNDRPGSCEIIIFTCPLGRIKLEFFQTPKVVDKKTVYSRRVGSDVKVDYVYDPSQTISRLQAYRYQDGADSWEAIESDNLKL